MNFINTDKIISASINYINALVTQRCADTFAACKYYYIDAPFSQLSVQLYSCCWRIFLSLILSLYAKDVHLEINLYDSLD